MLYFSEFKGKHAYTEKGLYLGKLDDLVFITAETPLITKLAFKSKNGSEVLIPIEYLQKFNKNLVIADDYKTEELKNNEAFIMRDVQDQQIIDLKGAKIIRVNDVVIQDFPEYAISGIDVGYWGILRWIGLTKPLDGLLQNFSIEPNSQFLPWSDVQPLSLTQGQVILKHQQSKLEKIRPENLAHYLEKTSVGNILKVVRGLDSKISARILANLNLNYQVEVLKNFTPEKTAQILSLVEPDEAADVLLTFSERRRKSILANIGGETKLRGIEHLLTDGLIPIDEVINTDFIIVDAETTVKAAKDKVKNEAQDFKQLRYVYVKNKEGQLIGVVSLHELLTQDSHMNLYKFMVQNLVVIRQTTSQEIAFKKMVRNNLPELPIVNEDREIKGTVLLTQVAKSIVKN